MKLGMANRVVSSVVLLSCVMAVMAGCQREQTRYRVELRPQATGFTRSVKIESVVVKSNGQESQQEPPISQQESEIFTAIFGTAVFDDQIAKFEGVFDEDVPGDVGAGGAMVRMTSELGDYFYYHERFRGGYPEYEKWVEAHRSLDQMTSWFTAWLAEELKDQAGAKELRAFIDRQLRADVHDLLLLIEKSSGQQGHDPDNLHWDAGLAIAHFLIERGYLSHADLARWMLNESADLDEERVKGLILQRIASGSGLTIQSPVIAFLADVDSWGESFERYLKSLPEYAVLVANRKEGDTKEVEVGELTSAELWKIGLGFLFQDMLADRLMLILHTQAQPVATNGQWDGETATVRWESKLPGRGDELFLSLPLITFAKWCQADSMNQQRLFGDVTFEGESLIRYIHWRYSLDADASSAWTELLQRVDSLTLETRRAELDAFQGRWFSDGTPPGIYTEVITALVDRDATARE